MRESKVWAGLKTGFVRYLTSRGVRHILERLENGCGVGTADVSYCIASESGWIELKQLKSFPVRPTTVVKIDHFTDEQRLWHRRRAGAGDRTWVFVRVGDEHYLFIGLAAALHVGVDWTKSDWDREAFSKWGKRIDWNELYLDLTTTRQVDILKRGSGG